MLLAGYELIAQHRVGKDGVSYQARTDSGLRVEVADLSRARHNPHRWSRMVKRLQLAASFSDPRAVRVVDLQWEGEPPVIVWEWIDEATLADLVAPPGPSSLTADPVSFARDLVSTIAQAHQRGLTHGCICPSRVRVVGKRMPKVDFTALLHLDSRVPRETTSYDALCRAPRNTEYAADPSADDVYGLGVVLALLYGCDPTVIRAHMESAKPQSVGDHLSPELEQLVWSMLAADPFDRPLASDVAARLRAHCRNLTADPAPETENEAHTPQPAATLTIRRGPWNDEAAHRPTPGDSSPSRLGRFRLMEPLGRGAMGTVYRAEDTADGTIVAVKVLHWRAAQRTDAVKRFRKEARLLSEIGNPYVARLLEVNQEGAVHYLVTEFVHGRNLAEVLAERESLEEHAALTIMADVARALVEPHERGIVHRDIKPENIVIEWSREGRSEKERGAKQAEEEPTDAPIADVTRARLVDFGLARHLAESDSLNVTRAGAVLGTPLYMPPEQGTGRGPITPAADVYAIGATLFHALAGRPPFVGREPGELIAQHGDEPAPRVAELQPGIRDDTSLVVERALAKSPASRYANANELLGDLERLLRRQPVPAQRHPHLPARDIRRTRDYRFAWDLTASPLALWPFVSDTDRLNQAVGLRAADFATQSDSGGRVSRVGTIRLAGLTLRWKEHPFEWIEGRRLSVLREFSQGPFKWFANIVQLQPLPIGGTRLEHRILLEPRSLLGSTVANLEVGIKARRSLARVYRRIDQFVTNKLPDRLDPYQHQRPAKLRGAQRRRLRDSLGRLVRRVAHRDVVRRLGDFLGQGAPQELARIRPLAFAHRFQLDPENVLTTFMHAAREGLLVLLWDILCPICRIPADVKDTLRAIQTHGQCPACNLDFEVDFASSVEMVFRASSRIRKVDLGTYCIGGPAHSPHVAAQVRLAAAERLELELTLDPGIYRLQSPQLPYVLEFQVDTPGETRRCDMELDETKPAPECLPALTANRQHLILTNRCTRELLVRMERTIARQDVLTGARAATMASFRQLFPDELLAPGDLINVATVTLIVADLLPSSTEAELGDVTRAVRRQRYAKLVADAVEPHHGAVFRARDQRVLAAFDDPSDAVAAALTLPAQLGTDKLTRGMTLRLAVDHGPTAITTVNDQLDYVGGTATSVERLIEDAAPGECVMTADVAADPAVATLLGQRGLTGTIDAREGANRQVTMVHRFSLPKGQPGHRTSTGT